MEQKHPYNFIVPAVIKDMLMNEALIFRIKLPKFKNNVGSRI